MSEPVWSNFNGYRGRTVDLEDGRTTTVYEHREVMARVLGRPLLPGEHARLHNPELPPLSLACVLCGAGFTRDRHWERSSRRRGKFGPFCGKVCAGRWSRQKQIDAGQVSLGGGRPRKPTHVAHNSAAAK